MKKIFLFGLYMVLLVLFSFNVFAVDIDAHGEPFTADASVTPNGGFQIIPLENRTITMINVSADCTAGRIQILNSSNSEVAVNTSLDGGNGGFNFNVTKGVVYYIVADDSGGSYDLTYGTGNFNYSSSNFNWTCEYYGGGCAGISNVRNIESITSEPNPVPPVPSAVSSRIDLLFSNLSSPSTYKILFGEGEDFNVFINFSSSNESVNLTPDDGVFCNVSLKDGLVEVDASVANFSLCGVGCDFSNYTEQITNADTSNAINDIIHFSGCHEQISQGDVSIYWQCGALSDSAVVSAVELPLCSSGSAFVQRESNVCNESLSVNVSVVFAGINNRRKRVTDLALDREFSVDVNVFPVDVFYNSSLALWVTNHSHEYYEHGQKMIWGNCSLNSSFFNSTVENITVVNAPPVIFIEQVNTSLGFTNLSDGVVIEYAGGVWNWFGAVIDDDADTLNVTWFNSSGFALLSFQGSPSTTVLNSPDALFVDFSQMPYSINVSVNDTEGLNANASLLFNVSDSFDPSCNFSNMFVEVGVFEFDVLCVDENFFSLNVSCPLNPNQNFSISGLNVPEYVFNQSFNFSVDDVCVFEYCDGHTKNVISLNAVRPDDSSVLVLDSKGLVVGVVSVMNNSELEFELEDDRIKFNVVFDNDDDRVIWYQASKDSVYLSDPEFLGWVVSAKSRTWFDLNNDLNVPVVTEDLGDGLFKFTLLTTERRIDFYSVGELNCVVGSFAVTIQASFVLNFGSCPTDLPGVATLWLVFFIALFFMSVGWIIKNREAGFLGSFLLTFLSLNIVICHRWAGWICALAGMYFMLWFVFKK